MTYIIVDAPTLMRARLEGNFALPPIAPPFEIRSTFKHPDLKRVPIKHLLIGSPPAIRHTIHRLHQLHYAEANEWSKPLVLPDQPLIINPDQGDAVAILVRYLNLE